MRQVIEIDLDIYELKDGSLIAAVGGPDGPQTEMRIRFHKKTDDQFHDAWCNENVICGRAKQESVEILQSKV
jgi:hypothetical protein